MFNFQVLVAGFASNQHLKRMILGGLVALQTSRLAGRRITRIIQ
jgi:hypothetical protein